MATYTAHLFLLAFLMVKTSGAQERPQMARYGKAYRGNEGLRVIVSPLASGNKALVQFYGINHEWDRKIFMCDYVEMDKPSGTRTDFTAKVDGGNYVPLITYAEGYGEVYLKGKNNAVRITYSDGDSQEVQNEHILTAYLQQEQEAKSSKKK
jgi:hypothetical protein